jgi:hypothetical protein
MFILSNCSNESKRHDYKVLNFREGFDIEVERISIKNKLLILNDTFMMSKENPLIFMSHHPKWLFEKLNQKENEDIHMIKAPQILAIKAPYQIIKEEKSNVFKLIKKCDTLLFYLKTPNDLQIDL